MRRRLLTSVFAVSLVASICVSPGCALNGKPQAPSTSAKYARAADAVDTGVNILGQALVIEAVLHAAGDIPDAVDTQITKAVGAAAKIGQASSATLRKAASETEAAAAIHDFIGGVDAVTQATAANPAAKARVGAFVTAAHLILDALLPLK